MSQNKWIDSHKFTVIQDFRDHDFLKALYKAAGGWNNVFQTSGGLDNLVTFEVPAEYTDSVRQCMIDWGIEIKAG